MRNAVAHLDDDLLFDAPMSKTKARSKSGSGTRAKKKSAGQAKPAKRKTGRYVALGVTGAMTIGIIFNALSMQHGPHPAPLFGTAIMLGAQPAPQAASASAAAPAPTSVTAALPEEAPAVQARPEPSTAPTPAPIPASPVPAKRDAAAAHPHHVVTEAPAPAAAPVHRAKNEDAIAALLGGQSADHARDSAKETPKESAKDNPKTIMAAQHALMKLGYVVTPNGTYSAATRGAIQAFEREQHLPVSGELSRKLLKQLSAESGVAID